MEGLATAASVAGVVQLVGSVRKLYEFWDSIKDAPEEIRAIALDLRLLSSVLAEIASDAQHVEPDHTLEAVMEACHLKVKALNAIVNEIELSLVSSRSLVKKWAAVKGVLKAKKVNKFRDSLGELKITLMLERQTQNDRLSRQTLIAIGQANSTLSAQKTPQLALAASTTLSAYQKPLQRLDEVDFHTKECTRGLVDQPSTTWKFKKASQTYSRFSLDQNSLEEAVNPLSSHHHMAALDEDPTASAPQAWSRLSTYRDHCFMDYFFGNIRMSSRTDLLEANNADDQPSFDQEDLREQQLTYIFSPATWLTKLGLNQGFHVSLFSSSIKGWKFALNTFRVVPDDSLVFKYCEAGDLDAVRLLLTRGEASVKDVDSYGRTALYVAAQNLHPKLCKFLVNAGAEKTIRDYNSQTILDGIADLGYYGWMQAHSISGSNTLEVRIIDTLRIFIEYADFSGTNSDGWNTLSTLVFHLHRLAGHVRDSMSAVVLWALSQYSYDIKTNFNAQKSFYFLDSVVGEQLQDIRRSFLRLGPDDAIDCRYSPGGYSHLLWAIAWASDLSWLLDFNPNLHVSGYDWRFGPYEESPTSLSMYSSQAFAKWRNYLERSGVDICEFITCELVQGPLAERGWDFDTLQRLFQWDFEQTYDAMDQSYCCDCHRETIMEINIQPYWLKQLDELKQGIDVQYQPTVSIGVDQGPSADSGDSQLEIPNETSEVYNFRAQHGDNQLPANTTSTLPTENDTAQSANESPTASTTSEAFPYGKDETVDMYCWRFYQRTGRRFIWLREESSATDKCSENEFSPFHIHT